MYSSTLCVIGRSALLIEKTTAKMTIEKRTFLPNLVQSTA